MAIFLILLSGACIAFSNLMMRKSIDSGGTTKGYMVFMMMIAFLFAILLDPVRSGNYAWNGAATFLGVVAGLIYACMFYSLGKALEKGPPGLTFSLLSSSSVMPAILMAFLFGANYGFPYTTWHAIGSLLVVGGIFWAGRGTAGMQDRIQWIFFSFLMFTLHIALLSLFQWRSLLQNFPRPEEITSLITREEIKSVWFLPLMFLTCGLIQLFLFIASEKRWPKRQEIFYGTLGGGVIGTGTFFLTVATSVASPLESAIIFPIYSVAIIVLSNLWGQKLYQERVNWRACQISSLGLIIASVNWKGVLSVLF